jgi:hypothetical protein
MKQAVKHATQCIAELTRASDPAIIAASGQVAENLKYGSEIATSLAEAKAASDLMYECLPDTLELGVVGIGSFLRICVKIYDAIKCGKLSKKDLFFHIIEIIMKNISIGFVQLCTSTGVKFVISSIIKGLMITAPIVAQIVSSVFGGLALGFIGYELGEIVGKLMVHFIPNPENKSRQNWVNIAKWSGFFIGAVAGITLCVLCPMAGGILVGAAVAFVVAKVLVKHLNA